MPNRKRQANEELKQNKGLAQLTTERRAKVQRTDNSVNHQMQSVCQCVSHMFSELEPVVRHLAHHKIWPSPFSDQKWVTNCGEPISVFNIQPVSAKVFPTS